MKWILYVYLGISILTFILYTLTVLNVSKEFKRRYPNIKAPNTDLVDKILTFLKVVLFCFVPIVNIVFLFYYFTWGDVAQECMIKKMYLKLSKEESENEQH